MKYCGWEQNYDSIDFPVEVRYPNRVSYNKAKQLYKEGEPFIPTIEDFMGMLYFYSEVEFHYKGKGFGVVLRRDNIEIYKFNVLEGNQTYKTVDEFLSFANIDGVLLKDIWDKVVEANYMGCY